MILCCCCCCCCYNLATLSLNKKKQQQQRKLTHLSYESSTKERYIAFQWFTIHLYVHTCLTCICFSQLRYYNQLLMDLNQIFPTVWVNILQDLHGQSSHFQVLMRFLKRAREAAKRISVDTCCQSWLVRYGIESSTYFSERGFSVWKMWKLWSLYTFFLTWKYHS